jgi:uncharacterized RDD family membrane protein YckC
MSDAGPKRIGLSFEVKPHAYDPIANPEYFEGVLARRMLAFIIDALILLLPVLFVCLFILLFGLVTLGLAWLLFWPLFWVLPAATVIWAVLYYGMTLGGPKSATLGMRVMDIEMRTWYGGPAYFLLGAVHAIAYWISVSALTPFILLVALFNSRRRLLHDMLLGTIVVNSEARAQALRRVPVYTPPTRNL